MHYEYLLDNPAFFTLSIGPDVGYDSRIPAKAEYPADYDYSERKIESSTMYRYGICRKKTG